MKSDEICELQVKAEAYDRLMSGGATPKELANILHAYVACNADGRWVYFFTRPAVARNRWTLRMSIDHPYYQLNHGNRLYDLPPCSCHWVDSLLVPDGWEETCSKN